MPKFNQLAVLLTVSMLLAAVVVLAQFPPPMRQHTATKKQELQLVLADQQLPARNEVAITEEDGFRVIRVNSIPEHKVGRFPNRGNPHRVEQISTAFRVPLMPRSNDEPYPIRLGLNFGVAVNGILFDPSAAEFWQGNPRLGWQYEALGGAVPLGLDENYAHVQPSGKYHYHGLPSGLLGDLHFDPEAHSPLVGWAADGFPIYARFGYSDPQDPKSAIVELHSSYRLKQGDRPAPPDGPGGAYDGAFLNDYELVARSGDLDECNGRTCVTPEFPAGTYAYFLTSEWPVIPRQFRGTPDPSFQSGPGGPPGGPGRGPRPGPPPRGAR